MVVIRNLLLSFVALLVLCLCLEGVLRTTHMFNARVAWTEPDPQIGYRFTPNRHYWFFAENDHPIEGRINALGWRDHERPLVKPAGCRRIAVLGDSFVEAFQVELDSTFVAIAERRLAARDGCVQCLNFGRSGMTTTEERIVLERDVLAYAPDDVVLLLTPVNDFADVNPATADGELRPFPRIGDAGDIEIDTDFTAGSGYRVRVRLNPLKQRSALVSLFAERYNLLRRARAPQPPATLRKRLPRELSLGTAHPDSVFLVNYGMNKLLIAAMARLCAAHGVRFWLASVPPVRGAADIAAARALDPSFDPGFLDRDLAALADTLGAGFVPMTAPFLAAEAASAAPLYRGHWTCAGHRVAAGALAAALGNGKVGARLLTN
ncbi:MAG TPA: SGNH/GDSL hydrolase family protein [Candidatus Krumholzibacteria bacterium]|nr:SGNH/GDSL hydrolase family protein [Candidatus Krumholzibacteria bacterium]